MTGLRVQKRWEWLHVTMLREQCRRVYKVPAMYVAAGDLAAGTVEAGV